MRRRVPRSIAVLALAALGVWLSRVAAAPTVSFEIDPPNPVAGQEIRFRDTSAAGDTSWLWDFGDGGSATSAAPSHTWSAPGAYVVKLTSQGATVETPVTVSADSTLRLLAVHPFEISIDVEDPGNGATSPARAVAVTDRFGWFSFPDVTHDPGNPEVTVKGLEAPTFGHYWIFWSAMTSLHYTMTVRDVTTGHIEIYEKTDDSPCGSWDTENFPYAPTPTPAPPTETPVPGQPTRTRTPTPTPTGAVVSSPTPTPTPTPTRTPTPTPSGPTMVTLRATSWQWDWCPSADQGFLPCQAGACPYTVDESAHGVISLQAGCTYQVTLYNTDPDEFAPYHTLNAHPEIGIPSPINIPMGQVLPAITVTTNVPPGDITFSCNNTSCGTSGQHEGMLGLIHVTP
jgi:PKD repeat protein